MADINATDLTQETASTLDGTEQFVLFDLVEGKRATVSDIKTYILSHIQMSESDGVITIDIT